MVPTDPPLADLPLPDERSEEHRPTPPQPAPDHHPGDGEAPPPEPPTG